WGAALPAQGIAWVARRCAAVPWGALEWDKSAWGAVLLALLTVAVILIAPWMWHRSRTWPLLALAVVAVTAAFVVPTSLVSWPPPGWAVVACDVGEGDGLVVSNGPGHAVVVDTGTEPAVIDSCLRRLGVDVVDLVVLTHFHADHAGGLAGVLDGRRVGEVRVSPVKEPQPEAKRVSELAAQAGVPVSELRAGQSWAVGGVSADVWWPAREISEGSVPNNGSIVMTVRVAGLSVLMTGDMEREAAAEVVRAARADPGKWGHVDVLKVAHHGSSNRDDRVLESITGRVALISVGADNDYGHPAPPLLKVLEERGFTVHRTDLEGALAVVVGADGRITVRSG
ncbi:MAG TPA: MBL fold metallo-hydrolase, partial [Intrasporangium sp.]|nr:MBL fold metallo-hydrolase [Intrasporangium sp.]